MPILIITTNSKVYKIHFNPGPTVREIIDSSNIRVRSSCGGTGSCGLCSIQMLNGASKDHTAAELNKLTVKEREQGARLACQCRPTRDLIIVIDNPAVSSSWRSLSAYEHSPTFDRLQPIPSSDCKGNFYGVAVDLGTTQIRVSLWDLHTGKVLAGRSGLNPQSVFGADVLSRMVRAAESREHSQEMGRLATGAIAEALQDIGSKEAIDTKDVAKMVLVGNTPMISLLTGKNHKLLIKPDYWTKEVDCAPEDLVSLALSLGFREETHIEIVRPMAGFVGSDLLAGIIATQLVQGPAGSLLIDFGTNSEIALWDGEKLWITSAAGGPAFEGSGISYGMPAEPGAVYRIAPRQEGSYPVEVIGGGAARGICGSGLVDIIACLLSSGQLKKNGRFTLDIGEQGFPVLPGEEGVYLKKGDVDLFQRAKGGIAAGTKCLMKRAALKIKELQRVCVCGAFGTFLNIENAQAIGLLPAIPARQLELCGNTALTGCERLLFSSAQKVVQSLKQKAELVNMAGDMDFEQQFIENLFLQPMQAE